MCLCVRFFGFIMGYVYYLLWLEGVGIMFVMVLVLGGLCVCGRFWFLVWVSVGFF